MKKSTIILLHSGYWFLYCFLLSFLFLLSHAASSAAFAAWEDLLTIILFALFAGLISFYAFYLWIAPRFLETRRNGLFIGIGATVLIATALVSTCMVSVATSVVLYIALHQRQFVFFQEDDQFLMITGFMLLGLLNAIIGTLIRLSVSWYRDIHLKELMAARTLHTELALLKAQINPHFLFNTLNNIDILIEQDTTKASLYLNNLSDLLRFVIYESSVEKIALRRELDYVGKYMNLQKIRTVNESYADLKIEGKPNGHMIPPMLFIPFIENAFKFTSDKKKPEAIRIKITISENEVIFQCSNVFDPERTDPKEYSGLGNKLLRQRLELLYGKRYSLKIQKNDNIYAVTLTVPSDVHEMSLN